MSTKLTVLIAGAGVGGLMMGILLDRMGIRYHILEKAKAFTCLGSSIAISPQVLRLFNQLGMLDELLKIGKPITGLSYFRQDMTPIGRNDMTSLEERYGYPTMIFSRPELMDVLLSKICKSRISKNKRILEIVQNCECVTVKCSDRDTYEADILIGCDGAYSAVRQSLYKSQVARGVNIPAHDQAPLRFNQFALVGVANLKGSEGLAATCGASSDMSVTVSDKLPYSAWIMPLKDNRVGWGISGNLLNPQVHEEANFKFSDWGSEYIDETIVQVRDIACPLGGVLGQLLDCTERTLISKIMLEDKCFSTWYGGRVVLMGDACHKLIPFAGQGAIQTILDAICLSNLLYELPSGNLEHIERAFEAYARIRHPIASAAVDTSILMMKIVSGQSLLSNWSRKLLFNMPTFMYNHILDRMYSGRPIVHFLDPVPLYGSSPDTTPLMTAYPSRASSHSHYQVCGQTPTDMSLTDKASNDSGSSSRSSNTSLHKSKARSINSSLGSNNSSSASDVGSIRSLDTATAMVAVTASGAVGSSNSSTDGSIRHRSPRMRATTVATLVSDAEEGGEGDKPYGPSFNKLFTGRPVHQGSFRSIASHCSHRSSLSNMHQ